MRIIALLCAWAGLLPAARIVGDVPELGFGVTRAEVVIPAYIEGRWSDYAVETVDETYRFTITGGTGTADLFFDVSLYGHEGWGVDTYYFAGAGVDSPFPVWQGYGDGAYGSYACSGMIMCPSIEFEFGVPFTLRFQALSSASFDYYGTEPWEGYGSVVAETWIGINGVYSIVPQFEPQENAVIHVQRLPLAETPEPGMIWLVGGVLAAIAARRASLARVRD